MSSASACRPAAALIGILMLPAGLGAQNVDSPMDWRRLHAHEAQWRRLLAAEDARAPTAAELEILHDGLHAPVPELRAMAVRALGRLERAAEAPHITPLLHDTAAIVRAYAANALAQALVRDDAGGAGGARDAARAALRAALEQYRGDPVAAPVMAETLGRMRHATATDARQTVAVLLPLLNDPALRLGALRGLYFLSRQQGMRMAWDEPSLERLRTIGAAGPADDGDDIEATRFRALAVATLAAAGGADATTLLAAMRDVSPFVRREAVVAGFALPGADAALDIMVRALNDGSGIVRYEGLRQYGRRFRQDRGCAPILEAAADVHPHTALLALELLAGCAGDARAVDVLRDIAGTITSDADDWHRPARALVALAAMDPERARALAPALAEHASFFARTYAARAAARTGDAALLRRLAGDAHANVRTVAIEGLHALLGRAADDVVIAQLAHDDAELLQAAARALESSPHAGAPAALLDALDRVTARREETSRDARRALLTRIGELGNAAHAPRVEPYVADFDPLIAGLAADVINAWTGTRPEPRPTTTPALPLPTLDELIRLAEASVVIELEDGAEIVLRLLPFEAPTNAARFARLARSGYYDGLTLHRVVPNFVVQGGSPGANEYSGDGPFTRDELGLARNWRGGVGLSTRGRDTGDAQLYINTVDNVRLDHDYTIFAEVVRGMSSVDAVLEGARIVAIEFMRRAS